MSALPLFDVVLSSHRRSRVTSAPSAANTDLLTDLTGKLVRSALTELQQIEALDASLADHAPAEFDEHTAAILHGMYDQWARDADAVLDRATNARELGVHLDSAIADLRHAQGRVRAALAVTPQAVADARSDFAAGRSHPIEEVRRELRAGVQ
jgi:hypothetical protein